MAKTTSLRDKYKATPLDVLKQTAAEEDKMVGSSGGREGYHTIDDGSNKFRIYPKKEDDRAYSFLVMKHWHTILDDEDEPKRTTVYNARIHGGLKRDINEEYIKDAQIKIKADGGDEEDKAKKLKALTDWQSGVNGSTAWIVWADKISRVNGETKSELALLELKKTMRDDLNSEAMMEDPEEEIVVDPYTDPDTGKAFLLNKEKKKQKGGRDKTVYTIKIAKESPLTDEQLEIFEEKKSLTQMFSGVYSERDFDTAVEGLKYFDDKFEVGLFDDEDWLEKVKAMKKEVKNVAPAKTDDEDEEEEKPKKSTAKSTTKSTKKAPVVEEEEEDDPEPEVEDEEEDPEPEEETGDEFDEMTRAELVKYKTNNELDIKIYKSDSDDAIREKIREAIGSGEETPEEEVEEEEEKPKAKAKVSLNDIKNRISSQKGNSKK